MKNKKHFLNSKNIYIGLVVFIMVVFALGAAVAQPLKAFTTARPNFKTY